MMTIRPAFTAFICRETGLSVLGPECGQIPTSRPELDQDIVTLARASAESELPAGGSLATILRAATPEEAISRDFRPDPKNQAIFRTELHSTINDARLGTLFVDTTPNRPGVQYFFQSSSTDNP